VIQAETAAPPVAEDGIPSEPPLVYAHTGNILTFVTIVTLL
jgi:hypothetical protein